nr:transmembrane protein 272-like [Rhipicephalus microplus]
MYCSNDNLLHNAKKISSDTIDMNASSSTVHYGSTHSSSRFCFGNDESVLERLRQAREENPKEVAAAVWTLCLSHGVFALIVLATFLVPAASIVIGALTIHECPRQPMVPVLLLLGGLLALVNGVANLVARSGRLYPTEDERQELGAATALLNVALFFVFIAGCVYVYGSLWPSWERASGDYCSPTAFYFSFWLHTGLFIFLGLLLATSQLGLLCKRC